MDLPPYGAELLRYPAWQPAPRRIPPSGPLPGLKFQALPPIQPVVGAGEFVEKAVAQEAGWWSAVATLKRGGVDTHLFLSFRHPAGLDLSGAAGLAVRTATPSGQGSGASLLLIVRDADGGEYLANAGRPLSRPGEVLSVVPWSLFQAAGWSTDPNGRLDLGRITAINVGWGGYYGAEGERIQMRVRAPEAFRLPARPLP